MQADSGLDCDLREAVNFGERAEQLPIDILLLHYTGMESGLAAENWLCCEESGVSCHYLIHEDGRVVQMVPEAKRAWHAGKSIWQGEVDTNSRSIGIEIVNPGHGEAYCDFPDVQMKSVIDLSLDILNRHSISPQNVLAHSDVAPGRKLDPGEKFNWQQLFEAGIGHWCEASPSRFSGFLQLGDQGEPITALQSMLNYYGYGVEVNGIFNDLTKANVFAFQQHFRQHRADGIADGETIATLDKLIRSLPEPKITK